MQDGGAMVMKAPCKDCPKRYPGCHDSCPEFAEYRTWAQEKNRREKQGKRSKDFYDQAPLDFAYTKYW